MDYQQPRVEGQPNPVTPEVVTPSNQPIQPAAPQAPAPSRQETAIGEAVQSVEIPAALQVDIPNIQPDTAAETLENHTHDLESAADTGDPVRIEQIFAQDEPPAQEQ